VSDVVSLALLERPDGRWTVHVESSDGDVTLTEYDREIDARFALLDYLVQDCV